mmetsp:Transcript_10944/g.18298  ORF Transcript_10944/g.18298 Transcript_10944/m.18298 type:complete len:183 (+) Transcript_10944:834-1382(+)
MQFLHDDLSIIHRDLKHQNILMGLKSPDPMSEDERQPLIKVCDFTTSAIVPDSESKVQTQAGTLAFNAPEQFEEGEFLPMPLDVWAFGISLFVYLTDNLPYENYLQCDDVQQLVVSSNVKAIAAEKLEQMKCSEGLIQLLNSIFDRDPKKRPTFTEILEHRWLEGRVEVQLSTDVDLFADDE